ncbi:MAG TPA: adenosylmethionine--8-amino-7-oxononanoate aminotransferase BioA, partial [Alphaproteobacteria bacterium]|nr:adenosylmethionine--8-amino-7-oxononanoate aminotransferase BioA [Alphaproteobacteria bacterium]
GNKRKNKFVCFKNGYHGDTMGALSLNDPESWIAKAFNNYAPQQFCVDLPFDEYGFAEFEEILSGVNKDVAAVIIEPLVQGAGGLKFYSADILAEIYRLTKKHNLLFIADEIMTGFYRAGNIFACNEAGIVPDIMCIGKALTGGMISLGAVVTTDEIFNAFLSDTLDKALLHGPTFMANPLACSAAIASLELFEQENYIEKVERIEGWLSKKLMQFRFNPKVAEVRVKGAIGVVELKPFSSSDEMWNYMFALRQKCLKHNVWLRPFENIIYIMPNFNITENEIDQLVNAIREEL